MFNSSVVVFQETGVGCTIVELGKTNTPNNKTYI